MKMNAKTMMGLLAAGTLAISGVSIASSTVEPTKPQPSHDKAAVAVKADKKDEKKAKVGEKAPSFKLTSSEGKEVKLEDYKDKIVVLEWFNPGCPFVKKHHELHTTMTDTYNKYKDKGVVWLAINSGAAGKEGAGKDACETARKDWKINYPILVDESGDVGRSYGAKTTPHMFVIGKDGTLVYAGAIDDNNDGKELGKTNYVANAIEATLKGETVKDSETKPYGCGVKYASR